MTKDEEEIRALIDANRIAVWTQDFAAYEKCFVHADYTTRWNASRFYGIAERQGWDEIAERVHKLFADPTYASRANAYDTTVHNLRLQIRGEMAWATFDQRYPDSDPSFVPQMGGLSREVRVFERHEGKWLIAFWGIMDASVGGRDAAVIYLKPDGTVIWMSPPAVAALETDDDVVIRNGRLRIRDGRTNEALQTAIAWAAEKDAGLLSLRGALPIVHDAGEGLPTCVWWVLAGDGAIVFSMGTAGFNEKRLDAAAAVFGLSPAQKQLAAHIAAGRSLPEIAEAMNITTNTARTHLDRIYEKVGVRTQPSLVRVLLSTAAPI
ncbi:MAG: helix-turn-helix transcriptional regulator [Devosia sp.]